MPQMINRDPLVSIILPVYNVENELHECLNSVCAQDYPEIEVVAVNDGSTDGSRRILESFQRQGLPVRILDQPNRGLSVARNTGIDAAHGAYVMFLDADDVLQPVAVGSCVEYAELMKLEAVTFNAVPFGDKGSGADTRAASFAKRVTPMVYTGTELFEQLLNDSSVWVCACFFLFRREFLNRAGLRFKPGIVHEDIEFTPRALLKLNRIGVLDQALYRYRLGREGAITSALDHRASDRAQLAICNDLYAMTFHAGSAPGSRDLLERYITHRYRMLLSRSAGPGKSSVPCRTSASRTLRSWYSKPELLRRLSFAERYRLITQYVVPELDALSGFLSEHVVGPIRRAIRYQIVPRLRR